MTLSFFLQNVLLGFGLAMDSFSVSIADTLSEPDMTRKKGLCIAGTFGFCQAAFPLIGWFFVRFLLNIFIFLEKLIPWAALILLAYIGGNMIREGLSGDDSPEVIDHPVSAAQLALQGVATAIDALSVGLTIAEYTFMTALNSAIIVGIVTFLVCIVGLRIGKKLGESIGGRASVLGGCILILIGIKVLLDHYL
ncbi:MAG: manganese efflux pump [Oscillospiraceae bacterium]|nr:manganese efflux pump [Oscillospiraceae bacterium]